MLQVERHYHKGNDTIAALCKTSKKLYNKCNFLMRQAWFGNSTLPNINDLVAAVKDEDCFKNLHNTKTAEEWVDFAKLCVLGKFFQVSRNGYCARREAGQSIFLFLLGTV